jgi:arylsulfatase A-like enzyme
MATVTSLSRPIPKRRFAVGAGILLPIALLALWKFWWPASVPSIHREAGLNVLLMTLATLRADAVGAYGQNRGIAPWIDRLAAAGARFTDAHAHNIVTLPSHANILSGRLPGDHGDALAFVRPSALSGRSLLPVIARDKDQATCSRATYFEARSATLNRRWAPLHGVIQDGTKYIDLPIPELYDLSSDLREQYNLEASQPARVEALRTLLGP